MAKLIKRQPFGHGWTFLHPSCGSPILLDYFGADGSLPWRIVARAGRPTAIIAYGRTAKAAWYRLRQLANRE